jgi:histidinol dehydrogenase
LKIIQDFELAKKLLSRQTPMAQALGIDEREQAVRQIIDDVRRSGDTALFDYTEKFDGVKLASLEVSKKQITDAYQQVDAKLVSALKLAAERIEKFHIKQKESLLHDSTGESLGWLIHPLKRVGVHAPGFTAPLPSSLLMTAIPARVAGVKEIFLVTPPMKQGGVSPITLVAADIAGVDRVFSVGGSQAIAALAFGTESIPSVDKVCGPGNIYVLLAKKLLYGVVGIDGLYGPSEVLIIADETATPEYCAADLLAQAEHTLGSATLITTSPDLASKVVREVEKQLEDLPYQAVAAESLENRGMVVIVKSVDEAIELANLYAPEHLCLVVDNAASYVDRVSNAPCIFIGENSVEAIVDYVAGPSHVLPTEGVARFSSPLNVTDFVKMINIVDMNEAEIKELGQATSTIARAEGLEAHARAVEKRLEKYGKE